MVALVCTHLFKVVDLDAALVQLILQLLQLLLEVGMLTLAYLQVCQEAALVLEVLSVALRKLVVQLLDVLLLTDQTILVLREQRLLLEELLFDYFNFLRHIEYVLLAGLLLIAQHFVHVHKIDELSLTLLQCPLQMFLGVLESVHFALALSQLLLELTDEAFLLVERLFVVSQPRPILHELSIFGFDLLSHGHLSIHVRFLLLMHLGAELCHLDKLRRHLLHLGFILSSDGLDHGLELVNLTRQAFTLLPHVV